MIFRPILSLFFLIAGTATMYAQQAEPVAGEQVEQQFTTSDAAEIPYLLYLPKNHNSEGEGVPLMLFLHGRGESDGPLSLVAKWGPPGMVAAGEELPYLLISPQCPADDAWEEPTQQKRLQELLDALIAKYNVDSSRIYLTGLSMGGYGSWRFAADHPERFAAVIPICGGGNPDDAERLKNLPIWVFHGDQDDAVPFERSVEMVEAIREVGGNAIRFTSLEHIGHNSWSPAYATPELYSWLDRQKRDSAD